MSLGSTSTSDALDAAVRNSCAWKTSDIATATLTGTSMSAPHTTGVAAL